jgi:aminoglycoside phosphotransferase (APT) family kinase protein
VNDTAPIRPDEQFDEQRVAGYLHDHLPKLFASPTVEFDQFPGGAANLTYRARTDEGSEFVLRRAPLGPVAKGGHDMEREYTVLASLWRAFPLAPRAYHFCADDSIMGKPFFVMERRRGHVVRKSWPPPLDGNTDARLCAAESLIDALADLHAIEPAHVGLEDLGRPAGFVQRQIEGWAARWATAATRPVPDMDATAALLIVGVPDPQRVSILHNDYKLDNTMVGDDGRLVAIFDWDMATTGDPLVDAGTMIAYWAQPDDPTYLVFGENAVAIGEVMDKTAARARYADRSGLDVSNVTYYEALALFRIAVIIEQIYARYAAGHTHDARFAAFEHVPPILASAARDLLTGRQNGRVG